MNTTTRQQGEETRERILQSIIQYVEKHGYPPTVREIGKMAGLKSTSSIQGHLSKMFESGMIETDHGVGASRAIRVPGYKLIVDAREK